MKTNLFITIEGLSGSGKTTIALLLAKKINGYYIKPPGYPFDIIRDEVDRTVDDISRTLFYLAGITHTSSIIKKEISKRSVVADKYIYTTLAFPRSNNILVEIPPYMDILMPDFSFYLETEDSIRLERITQREKGLSFRKPDMIDREREKRIREEFKKFNLIIITNNGKIKDTLSQIMKHLENKS